VLDFTTTHTWWAFDALLWDSLVAKLPGKPVLVQETGVSREVQINGAGRRNLDQEAALFERKLAIAAGTSAGAIEWLWNVNALLCGTTARPPSARCVPTARKSRRRRCCGGSHDLRPRQATYDRSNRAGGRYRHITGRCNFRRCKI